MKHHVALRIQLAPLHRVKTYEQAWLYCLLLDYHGYRDWRMPTLAEWKQSSDTDIIHASYCEQLTGIYHTRTCVCPVRDIC